MKVKGASIRELVHWIMNECLTEVQAERVLEGWLKLNGYMRHSTDEEKKLYEDMLKRLSIDIEAWNNGEVEIDTPSDLRFC